MILFVFAEDEMWWLVVVVGSSCRLNEITFYETILCMIDDCSIKLQWFQYLDLDREMRCRVCHDELALLEDDDSDLP